MDVTGDYSTISLQLFDIKGEYDSTLSLDSALDGGKVNATTRAL